MFAAQKISYKNLVNSMTDEDRAHHEKFVAKIKNRESEEEDLVQAVQADGHDVEPEENESDVIDDADVSDDVEESVEDDDQEYDDEESEDDEEEDDQEYEDDDQEYEDDEEYDDDEDYDDEE